MFVGTDICTYECSKRQSRICYYISSQHVHIFEWVMWMVNTETKYLIRAAENLYNPIHRPILRNLPSTPCHCRYQLFILVQYNFGVSDWTLYCNGNKNENAIDDMQFIFSLRFGANFVLHDIVNTHFGINLIIFSNSFCQSIRFISAINFDTVCSWGTRAVNRHH